MLFLAKRAIVEVDYEQIKKLSKAKHWSLASLCGMLGKHSTWLANVKIGRNLPSPEEAAQMCALLGCYPRDILTREEDIALVEELIEREKTPSPTKEDAEFWEYLTTLKNGKQMRILFDTVKDASLDELKATVAFLETLRGKRDDD